MASSSEIRKLFKAFSDNPAFLESVRAAKTPAEKHQIIRAAGHSPATSDEIQAELAKCLHPQGSGTAPSAADAEFVGTVAHLAAANSSDDV